MPSGHDEMPILPYSGTLTPFIPLSLRAFKGEGERRIEGSACARAQALPSNSVLVEVGGMDSRSATGGLSARRTPRRIFDTFSRLGGRDEGWGWRCGEGVTVYHGWARK